MCLLQTWCHAFKLARVQVPPRRHVLEVAKLQTWRGRTDGPGRAVLCRDQAEGQAAKLWPEVQLAARLPRAPVQETQVSRAQAQAVYSLVHHHLSGTVLHQADLRHFFPRAQPRGYREGRAHEEKVWSEGLEVLTRLLGLEAIIHSGTLVKVPTWRV